jgi:hypothetical protein
MRYVTAVVLALGLAPSTASAQPPVTTAALQGMWKLTSLSMDGVERPTSGYMVFSGDRYIFVTTRGERPHLPEESSRTAPSQMSDADKSLYVEAFRTMTAAAGTYTLVGHEIHYLREVVRSPQLTGKVEKRPSRLEGNRLIQDFIGGGQRQVMVWERVAGGGGK